MDIALYAIEAAIEETYWWFVCRRNLFASELSDAQGAFIFKAGGWWCYGRGDMPQDRATRRTITGRRNTPISGDPKNGFTSGYYKN